MNRKPFRLLQKYPGRLTGLMLLSILFLAACQSTAATKLVQEPTTAPVATSIPTDTLVPTPTPESPAVTEPSLSVVTDANLGQILVGDNGMTLYAFTKDEPDTSNCDSKCQTQWPPVLTAGNPNLGKGVDGSLIGTADLADGIEIVTYNHMPLYYFQKDTQPGDTRGQGVGSVWFAVTEDGKLAGKQSSSAVSPTATEVVAESSDSGNDTGYDYSYDDNYLDNSAVANEPTINVIADTSLGQILVGDNGMTLYAFTKDEPDMSNCDASCQVKWPPVLTKGSPILGEGVDGSLVGTAVLADGTKVLTYNHIPLYYFQKDTQPGDTRGQGVGSVWFVVSPGGEIVKN